MPLFFRVPVIPTPLPFLRYIRADGGPSEEAFVERKVHHDSWTTELSVKERFRLRAGDVGAFLAGSLDLKARSLAARAPSSSAGLFSYYDGYPVRLAVTACCCRLLKLATAVLLRCTVAASPSRRRPLLFRADSLLSDAEEAFAPSFYDLQLSTTFMHLLTAVLIRRSHPLRRHRWRSATEC